jgi:hypothetical protein
VEKINIYSPVETVEGLGDITSFVKLGDKTLLSISLISRIMKGFGVNRGTGRRPIMGQMPYRIR